MLRYLQKDRILTMQRFLDASRFFSFLGLAGMPMRRIEEFDKFVTDSDHFRPSAGQVLREIWDLDKVNFWKDQAKNGKL